MATQNSSLTPKELNVSSELPFNLDESSVSDWLENLSITDKIETCKTVFSTLQNLNRHSVESGARFAILEKFRTVVFLESSYLVTRLTEATFPLEQKIRKIAKLAAKFHSELASGYQLIADHDNFEEAYSNYQQACVLHRIIRSTGVSLLRVAQMYEPPSSKAWHLLKKIYREAESRQLLHIKIQDPTVPVPDSSTVAEMFATTILFTVSNPYRYSQAEMDRLFRYFETHSGKVEWWNSRPDQHGAFFAIDLEGLSPPQHSSSQLKLQSKSLRGIETSKFLAAISAPDTTQAHQPSALSEKTISTVLHHLGSPKQIRIKSLGNNAELYLGLEKIVGLLKLERGNPLAQRAIPAADWLVTPNFELLPLADKRSGRKFSCDTDYGEPLINNKAPVATSPVMQPDGIWTNSPQLGIGSSNIRGEVHQAELPGHVLVELKTDSLTIGQVIALSGAGSLIQIGVIRWMQASPHNHYFYYGVERLTSKCSLANVFISSRKLNDILLLEKNASGFSGYSLILPPAKYRSGTRLTVKQPRTTRNFIIEKLLETSPFFCQYSLK